MRGFIKLTAIRSFNGHFCCIIIYARQPGIQTEPNPETSIKSVTLPPPFSFRVMKTWPSSNSVTYLMDFVDRRNRTLNCFFNVLNKSKNFFFSGLKESFAEKKIVNDQYPYLSCPLFAFICTSKYVQWLSNTRYLSLWTLVNINSSQININTRSSSVKVNVTLGVNWDLMNHKLN